MCRVVDYFKPGVYENPLASYEWEFENELLAKWGVTIMSYGVFNNNEGVREIECILNEYDLEKKALRVVMEGKLKHYNDLEEEAKDA